MRLDPLLYQAIRRYHSVRFSHWEPDQVEARIRVVVKRVKEIPDHERQAYHAELLEFFVKNGFDDDFFSRLAVSKKQLRDQFDLQAALEKHEQITKQRAAIPRLKHPELDHSIRVGLRQAQEARRERHD